MHPGAQLTQRLTQSDEHEELQFPLLTSLHQHSGLQNIEEQFEKHDPVHANGHKPFLMSEYKHPDAQISGL